MVPDEQYLDIEEATSSKNDEHTETITECGNCHEVLDESSLDHHVCARIKVESLENEDEEMESSVEQDTFDESLNKKKKYPKKRLKDPISCPKCNRQFFYKAYFQFHYKDVHRDDREEICQFCGKVFKNSRRLNSHILIHQTDGEKKFKCDKCEKQFNFSGDFLRHKRVKIKLKIALTFSIQFPFTDSRKHQALCLSSLSKVVCAILRASTSSQRPQQSQIHLRSLRL